jgi:ABC-2 type transport system ATP-binding protein
MPAMPTPPTAAGAPAIETRDLAKRYGRTTALAGLTMQVERGEVFGFLGPNGAGKTTSIKLLLGLTPPTGGGGTVLGRPLGDREARRRVGYLPEMFRYQPWMRGREVLGFHAELSGLPGRDRAAAVVEALGIVGLADRSDDLVGTYSKGMQQRLGLATALLGRPELVLLDEPTSALDPLGRTEVRGIIRAARDRGATVFLNSHLLSEVELVCDRVAIVDAGRVVAAGTLDELLGGDGVRLRVTGLDEAARTGLTAFGPHRDDGDWLAFRPFAPERIPELVAAVVAAGGRVHAVEPERATLEERFLGLVGEGEAR